MALVEINELKKRPTAQSTERFIGDDTVDQSLPDLTVLTLDDLAARYTSIDQQSQLFKGLILLEARERLPDNKKFGAWIKSIQALCLDNQPTLTRYMNFAKYFKDKDRTGISLTAAYEISAPVNEAIADKIYEYALNKNLSVADIQKRIQVEKGVQAEDKSNPATINTEWQAKKVLDDFKKMVMSSVKKVPQQDAINVLQDCIQEIRAEIKELERQAALDEAKKQEGFTAALETLESLAIKK
jgi:hypothetical protein